MILKILLVLAILLQVVAAVMAMKLTKVTKYNLSWILITVGFFFMALRRLVEFPPMVGRFQSDKYTELYIWLGVITSLCFAVGVFLIQKIFNYMKKVESERRKSEERLLQAIIQAEENERKRFAKDLHDGLGPLLSTIKLSVSTLAQTEQNNTTGEIIQNTNLVVDEAVKSLKEISNNLSPHILNKFGFIKALRNFTSKINIPHGLEINLKTNMNDERFDQQKEVILYRVICELINNTIKHAKASMIDLTIHKVGSNLVIKYNDNGEGFNMNDIKRNGNQGMGFSNIYSRIDSIKGNITFDSKPNNGTSVEIYVYI